MPDRAQRSVYGFGILLGPAVGALLMSLSKVMVAIITGFLRVGVER